MDNKESLNKISFKTYVAFFIFFIIGFLVLLFYSYFEFSVYKFKPAYHEKAALLDNIIINRAYHINYRNEFIINNAMSLFLKNLTIITSIFLCFCYSLIINKNDTIIAGGRRIAFANIISKGLYLTLVLAFIYYISSDFIIPKLENKLERMRNNTASSIILLENGNNYFYKKQYENSLSYYEDYINIIINDKVITDRIREIKNKLNVAIFEKNKQENMLINPDETAISDSVTDYIQLAEYYFEKKDYHSSWYYYQHVLETDKTRNNEALNKINTIKKILHYENSMKSELDRVSDLKLKENFNEREREIKEIYLLKNKALNYLSRNEFQKAYFTYMDILQINPNLREIINAKNKTFSELNKIAVNIADVENSGIYPFKKDIVFKLAADKIMLIKTLIKTEKSFILKDVKIITYDNNFKEVSLVQAPFGENKGEQTITLYGISPIDRNYEIYPMITKYITNKTEFNADFMIELPFNISVLFDFTYDYDKTLGFSLNRLFYLRNAIETKEKLPSEINIADFEENILNKTDNNNYKSLLINSYTKDLISKKYKLAENVKSSDLKKIIQILSEIDYIRNFTAGYNIDYIETAIIDKITHLFLFFSVCLMVISISWRLGSNYYNKVPVLHYIPMLLIPFFIYFIIKLIDTVTISFYMILLHIISFYMVLVISFILNILMMMASIIFISSTSPKES